MATSTPCPSCGHQLGLPGSVVGPVTCPACGKAFEVQASGPISRSSSATRTAVSAATVLASAAAATAAGPAAVSAVRPSGPQKPVYRPPGSRPVLLDRLPKSFITSPPMIAAGGVFVLLYGLVMIPVVSAIKNRPEIEPVAVHLSAVAPIGPAGIPETSKPAPEKEKPPAGDTNKGQSPAASKKDEPGPKPDEPKKENVPEPPSPKDDQTKPAPKAVVAMVTKPKLIVPENLGPKMETWGLLTGSIPGDCKFAVDAQGLSINIPGSLHIIHADPRFNNAPRLLTEAGGDFTASVQVLGRFSSGNVPLDMPLPPGAKPNEKEPAPKFPLTFQGAGLMLSQDPVNYLRLERTAQFRMQDGKKLHVVLFELVRDGMIVQSNELPAKETDAMSLRIEKSGTVMKLTYSSDGGKTWLPVKRMEGVKLPPAVKVGVCASNMSAKPFDARFQNFDLAAAGPAKKK